MSNMNPVGIAPGSRAIRKLGQISSFEGVIGRKSFYTGQCPE
jgi:hypothetical protein